MGFIPLPLSVLLMKIFFSSFQFNDSYSYMCLAMLFLSIITLKLTVNIVLLGVSCKWVGLFTIATVGVSTLMQLWSLLGDLRVTPKLFMRHFTARAICLILIPVLFYMFMFWIHFLILVNPGDGDGFMSSEFQHTLNGRGMQDTFAGT